MTEMNIRRKLCDATFTKGPMPRTYAVTLSTDAVDRDNDRIDPQGWTWANHVPLLWGHDHSQPAIGRVSNLQASNHSFRGVIEFPPAGLYDFADTVAGLVDAKFLPSLSVGFRPLQATPNDLGGIDFAAQQLLELSVVNIPANTDAAIDGRMNIPALRKWWSGTKDDLKPCPLHTDGINNICPMRPDSFGRCREGACPYFPINGLVQPGANGGPDGSGPKGLDRDVVLTLADEPAAGLTVDRDDATSVLQELLRTHIPLEIAAALRREIPKIVSESLARARGQATFSTEPFTAAHRR